MANEGASYIRGVLPFPDAPAVTVYSPSGVAYMKVTPDAKMLKMIVRPRTITQSLIYAPLITHKIADTTNTMGEADATNLATSKTSIDEGLADINAHIASTVYHLAAGPVWYAAHKEDDATNLIEAADMGAGDLAAGYTLYTELKADLIAHAASTTFHPAAVAVLTLPGVPNSEALLVAATNAMRLALMGHFGTSVGHSCADLINYDLVAAAAADAANTAGCRTNLNLFKGYLNSHFAVGDATAADLAAVCAGANAAHHALLDHFDSADVHGGTADAADYATLNAVALANDQTTANALIHAVKDTYNAHCAIVDGGAYITAGPVGLPIDWPCSGAIWVKTDTSAGVFTTAEWKER
jgi:hypothetical protein